MRKFVLLLLLCLLSSRLLLLNAQTNTKWVLEKLDSTLLHRSQYESIKQQQIQQSKRLLASSAHSQEQEYQVLGTLVSQYLQYNTDSCKKYIDRRMAVARKLNNPDYITEVKLNLAEWYKNTGMYGEAYKLLNGIRNQLPPLLKPYYYMTFAFYYTMLEEYASAEVFKKEYLEKSMLYRDSLVAVSSHDDLQSLLARADNMRLSHRPLDAIGIVRPVLQKLDAEDINNRWVGANLAQCYSLMGDTEKAKYYFALSAISDVRYCVKENMSLRALAVILFQEGDVERANNYLQYCMRDAVDCKARLREVEAAAQMPTIVKAYQEIIEKKNETLMVENWGLFLLIAVLVMTAYYIVKQNHRLKMARGHALEMNKSLGNANKQLNSAIGSLQLLNKELSESNCIKDEYIVQYLNLSSSYIEKMEEYRHSLVKLGSEGKMDNLLKALRSTVFVEKQLRAFYSNFDRSFLKIFPTFIDDFNKMLLPEERLDLKADGQMPTEMRIFALIRLGIVDSNCLAQMLRCSVQTVYNYRSKIRTKLIDREEDFEQRLKSIGSIVS